MKKPFIALAALATVFSATISYAAADACPNLAGRYTIEEEGKIVEFTIRQTKANDVVTYDVAGMQYIADGQWKIIEAQGEKIPVRSECVDGSLKAESKHVSLVQHDKDEYSYPVLEDEKDNQEILKFIAKARDAGQDVEIVAIFRSATSLVNSNVENSALQLSLYTELSMKNLSTGETKVFKQPNVTEVIKRAED